MMKQLIKLVTVVLLMNIMVNQTAYSQDGGRTVSVTDLEGNPVAGALITIGEGNNQKITDENGLFTIQVKNRTPVLIEAEGFEPKLAYAMPPPLGMGSVVLIKMPYRMTASDKVNVPFGTIRNRQLTGAATILKPEEILKYDQSAGYAGALNGRVPGLFGANNIRGKSNPLVVVDGIPRSANDINLQEIEQITVLKDLSSAMMYGSQANNGVILISTKRGELLQRKMRVTAENGYSTPYSYPNFLNAADYMTYFNQARLNDGLSAIYSDQEIDNTRSGLNPVRYPDITLTLAGTDRTAF